MNMIKGVILFCALAATGISKADPDSKDPSGLDEFIRGSKGLTCLIFIPNQKPN